MNFYPKLKRILCSPRGHSLTEMLLTLMLVLVFGVTAFTLIFSGSDTYTKLLVNKDNSSDARIVLSTFNARIAQFDYLNGLECTNIDWNGQTVTAMVFHENLETARLSTWLFWANDSLYEGLTVDDELLTPDLAQLLMTNAELDVTIAQQDKTICLNINYPFGKQEKHLDAKHFLRT